MCMVSPDVGGTLGFCGQDKSKWPFHIPLGSHSMYPTVFNLIFGVNAKYKTRFSVNSSTVCLGKMFIPNCTKKMNWCYSWGECSKD